MGGLGGSEGVRDVGKSTFWVICVMVLLVLVGAANFVVFKIMYSSFGEANNFFVNQGVNLLYIIFGGAIVYPRQCAGIGTPEQPFPQYKFVIMAVLDAFGTFFTAMGAVGTPGQYQSLLNQTLIPLTMLMSFLMLRTRYMWQTIAGSLLILCGAAMSVVPSLISAWISSGAAAAPVANNTGGNRSIGNASDPSDPATTHLGDWAYLIYFASNIPMALSAVYKEIAFRGSSLDVYYLSQWVSIYQFILSFAFVPLLPFIGASGSLSELPTQFYKGLLCAVGQEGCAGKYTMVLLLGYTALNFVFNALGMIITKHGSAVLRAISYALILPLTSLSFAFPFMGAFREDLSPWTLPSLAVALLGFAIYQRYMNLSMAPNEGLGGLDDLATGTEASTSALTVGNANDLRDTASSTASSPSRGRDVPWSSDLHEPLCSSGQSSFQERVIGMGMAHRSVRPRASTAAQPSRLLSELHTGLHMGRGEEGVEYLPINHEATEVLSTSAPQR